MKSILQKLWQTPEYSNQDALRDMLGMTILVPDETSAGKIAHILSIVQTMMPNYGYIAKNRHMLNTEQFRDVLNSNKKKQPVYISSSSNPNTNQHLYNIALSGFTKHPHLPACGFEVQILTESGFEWKKQEDPYYKVRGMIELLTRGELFVTPFQLKSSLQSLIDYNALDSINTALKATEPNFTRIRDIDDLIFFLLQK